MNLFGPACMSPFPTSCLTKLKYRYSKTSWYIQPFILILLTSSESRFSEAVCLIIVRAGRFWNGDSALCLPGWTVFMKQKVVAFHDLLFWTMYSKNKNANKTWWVIVWVVCDCVSATRGCCELLVRKGLGRRGLQVIKFKFIVRSRHTKHSKKWLQKKYLSSHNWIFKPRQSANFEGMFPRN